MKGQIWGAEVEVEYNIVKRNGWTRTVPFRVVESDILAALTKMCPRFIKTLVAKDQVAKFLPEKDSIASIEFLEADELMGEIEKVEVKVYYKER